MTAEADREVRRFMKKNRIFVKPYSENAGYSATHEEIFGDILALGRYRLSSYTASIDIRLKDEPWRKHTKSRAQWLSRRALTLKEQQRNEAGWRYHLENHVLHRLLVEVACSKCRSRLWRSEIEPSIKGDVLLEEDLTKRRKAREPCSCPPDDRQWDIYETGLKNLFEDRIEDTVLAEASTESLLSDKASDRRRRPDRIFGLRETNNFEKLLDKVPSQRIGNPGTIRHSMRITPFKDTEDPLLFPFLVIEAKSGESRDGFSDIEFQSAIPVKALLQLQSQLRGRVSSIKTAEPLVWFLGYRGDSWRVYACYMSSDNPPACEIVFLWNGSLLLQDEALQLILILDYIVDWARDIYRPSVLRQLKSITSGKAFDEVSLVSDSDVLSIRRSVSRWPAPAPSIFDRLMSAIEPEVKFNVPPVMNAIPLSSPIIRSPRGVVRYLQQITKKMTGLCIWEANVQDFFNVINGGLKESAKSQTVAREIVNSFSLEERQKSGRKTEGPSDTTRQRNLQERTLCLTGSEIQALEESWMAETRHTDDFSDIPPQERFFCFISFECCLTTSWDVVKQITFLAVTKSALDIIVENARYKRGAPTLPAFLASWDKSFEDQALQDCIHCLSSSSPSQALLAAIHARSLTICGRARHRLSSLDDRIIHLDPEVLLDFDIDYSWRQGHLIEKLIKSIQRTKMDIQRVTNLAREHRTPAEEQRHNSLPSDFGFCRVGERADPIHDSREHVAKACLRCCQSEKRNWAVYHEPWNNGTLQVMNDMVVVVAPDASKSFGEQAEDNYNVCLFLLAAQEGASGSGKTLIEDTLRDMIAADQMYHSIRSPRRGSSTPFDELNWPYVMWNLPMPYRQNFPWETGDVRDWLTEHMEGRRIPSTFEWDRVRKLSLRKLYQGVLLDGKTHDEVLKDILTNEEVPQHQGTVAGKVESPTRDAPPSSSQTRTHLKRSDTCEGQQCSASTSTCHHLPLSQRSSDGTHSKKPHPQKTNLELELRQTPDAGTGGPVKSSAEENDTPIFCIPSSSPIAQSLPEFIDLTSDQEG